MVSIRPRQRAEEDPDDPLEEKRNRKLLVNASHHYCNLPSTTDQWAQPGIAMLNAAERISRGIFGWTVDDDGTPMYDASLARMTDREEHEIQEALDALNIDPPIDPGIIYALLMEHQEEFQSLRTRHSELDAILVLLRRLMERTRGEAHAERMRAYHWEHRDARIAYKREYSSEHREALAEQGRVYYREHRMAKLAYQRGYRLRLKNGRIP